MPLYRIMAYEMAGDAVLCRDYAQNVEMSRTDLKDAFHSWLEDFYYEDVTICGMEYNQADALRSVDPIAYRCAFADWHSGYVVEIDSDDLPERSDACPCNACDACEEWWVEQS